MAEGQESPHETLTTAGARQAAARVVVVMGVAGAGKTTVGRALAATLGWSFADADDYHPAANVQKMRRGVALTDADREPWLLALRTVIARHLASGDRLVLACSALRQSYRLTMRPPGAPDGSVVFVQLDITPELAKRRLRLRSGHYMPPSLVESQFATLEEPEGAVRLDGALPVDVLVPAIRDALAI